MTGPRSITLLLLALILLPAVAWAETRYVSDELRLSLRSGPSGSAKVLDYLRSDTPLEVLGEEGDYVRVRTPQGEEGYVVGSYLTEETPKPIVIAGLREEKAQLTGELAEQEGRLSELQEKWVGERHSREALEAENRRLAAEAERLEKESRELVTVSGIRWFLAGAGVFFVGWLCGRAGRGRRHGSLYS